MEDVSVSLKFAFGVVVFLGAIIGHYYYLLRNLVMFAERLRHLNDKAKENEQLISKMCESNESEHRRLYDKIEHLRGQK